MDPEAFEASNTGILNQSKVPVELSLNTYILHFYSSLSKPKQCLSGLEEQTLLKVRLKIFHTPDMNSLLLVTRKLSHPLTHVIAILEPPINLTCFS